MFDSKATLQNSGRIVDLIGPVAGVEADCERILRSLPGWFGDEESLLEYVLDTSRLPTFVVKQQEAVIAFMTVRQHFPSAWEVHCIAVDAESRGSGVGRALHRHVEVWLVSQGACVLQVKTMAADCPSPEYAETRMFYERIGFFPLEEFPKLGGPRWSTLQLVKSLRSP